MLKGDEIEIEGGMLSKEQQIALAEAAAIAKIQAEKEQALEELDAKKEADLATIEANVDAHLVACTEAQAQVEEAKAALLAEVQALKGKSLSKHEALKAELAASAKAIVDGAKADQKWAVDIVTESSTKILAQLDELMASHDALIGWIQPRPVDQEAIRKVIEKDLKTLGERVE